MRQRADQESQEKIKKDASIQANIKKTVTGTKAIIPGMELTKAEQDQLIKDMTIPVKFVTNGHGQNIPVSKVMELRSQDPITFEMRLNYFIQKGFFDKDAKFENLAKEATTNATRKLVEKMSTTKAPEGRAAADDDKQKLKEEFIFPFQT